MKAVIQISLIGAGLVVLGLALLWLLMAVLVRFTSGIKEPDPGADPTEDTDRESDIEYKLKASAASAAVAIALMKSSFLASSGRVDNRLTPWQSGHRANRYRKSAARENWRGAGK